MQITGTPVPRNTVGVPRLLIQLWEYITLGIDDAVTQAASSCSIDSA